jgi:hypothetical protein
MGWRLCLVALGDAHAGVEGRVVDVVHRLGPLRRRLLRGDRTLGERGRLEVREPVEGFLLGGGRGRGARQEAAGLAVGVVLPVLRVPVEDAV